MITRITKLLTYPPACLVLAATTALAQSLDPNNLQQKNSPTALISPVMIGSPAIPLNNFGIIPFTVSSMGTNSILGFSYNNLSPSTNSFPVGVTGYGHVASGSTGDLAFGLYGLGELHATSGVAVGAEFTAGNFSGAAPDVNLPPKSGIGTTSAAVIGENVTCRVSGDHDCSIGFYVSNETASYSGKAFNTGGYIGVFRQYGLFVEAQPSGTQTSAVIKTMEMV
jgi:hypothetical protein